MIINLNIVVISKMVNIWKCHDKLKRKKCKNIRQTQSLLMLSIHCDFENCENLSHKDIMFPHRKSVIIFKGCWNTSKYVTYREHVHQQESLTHILADMRKVVIFSQASFYDQKKCPKVCGIWLY